MKSYTKVFICAMSACCLLIMMLHNIEKSYSCDCGLSDKVFAKTPEVYPIPFGKHTSVKTELNSIKDASDPISEKKVSDELLSVPSGRGCNGIHALSCEEPYQSRFLHVQEQCKKKPQQNYSLLSLHYKFSDKLKLVMCETPKVASTTLQKLLVRLDSSFKKEHSWTKKHECGYWGNKCFTELSEREARLRTKTYTSFLISRHPLERVVSGYIDKLEKNDLYFRKWIGKSAALQQARLYLHDVGRGEDLLKKKEKEIKALKTFKQLSSSHQNDVLKYIHVMRTGAISFAQLVRFLVDQYVEGKVDKMDRHWKPQVDICQPCAFNYSCIMRFNDLAKDVNRMWDYAIDYSRFNVSKEDIYIKMRETTVGDNPVATQYYKQVPENHVQILRALYREDFLFYNYDPYLYHGY